MAASSVSKRERVKKDILRYRDILGTVIRTPNGPVKVARSWGRQSMVGEPLATRGNKVTPLIDGAAMMKSLYDDCLNAKYYVFLTAWLLESEIELKRPGTAGSPRLDPRYSVKKLVEYLAGKGVYTCFVLWDRLSLQMFSQPMIQKLLLEKIGRGKCKVVLYDETRLISSLHQKTAIIDGRISYCGGIDLAIDGGDHWDTNDHLETDKRRSNKETRNWHDVHVRVEGPAVQTIQENFVRRWKLSEKSNLPVSLRHIRKGQSGGRVGNLWVVVTRTIPEQGRYKFGANQIDSGDYSTVLSYGKAIINAQQFIYIENQYFSCTFLIDLLVDKLKKSRQLYVIVLLPKKLGWPMKGTASAIIDGTRPSQAWLKISKAAPKRILFVYRKNSAGRPVYVHSKLMIVDDVYATIGSANFTDRSMFDRDEELGIEWTDTVRTGGNTISRFRKELWSEHLGLPANSRDLSKITGRELFQVWKKSLKGKRIGPWSAIEQAF